MQLLYSLRLAAFILTLFIPSGCFAKAEMGFAKYRFYDYDWKCGLVRLKKMQVEEAGYSFMDREINRR